MMNEGLYFKADSSFRIIYVWEVKQENRRLKIAVRNIQTVTSYCYNLKFESRLKGNKLSFFWLRITGSRFVDHKIHFSDFKKQDAVFIGSDCIDSDFDALSAH